MDKFVVKNSPANTMDEAGAGAKPQHDGVPSLMSTALGAAGDERSHTHRQPLVAREWSWGYGYLGRKSIMNGSEKASDAEGLTG